MLGGLVGYSLQERKLELRRKANSSWALSSGSPVFGLPLKRRAQGLPRQPAKAVRSGLGRISRAVRDSPRRDGKRIRGSTNPLAKGVQNCPKILPVPFMTQRSIEVSEDACRTVVG
jgi:hypothetical protein